MAPGRGACRINITFRFEVRRRERIVEKLESLSPGLRNRPILKIAHPVCLDFELILIYSWQGDYRMGQQGNSRNQPDFSREAKSQHLLNF